MDTKEKNREQTRRPREQQPRKAAGETPEKTQGQQRRKKPEAPAQPRKKKPAAEQSAASAKRPQAPAAKRRPAPEGTASIRRSDLPENRTVHQGGPHQRAAKGSAPKRKPMPQQTASKPSERVQAEKKNALQNFISGVKGTPAQQEERAEQARQRRAKRAAKAERKRKLAERADAPAVIYTQPQTFNRSRLLVQLMTIAAVVAAMVIGMSVFFKVGEIHVAGAEVYEKWKIVEASGIQEGDNLLTFSRARASAQIRAELPYVSKVRIGIKLPETVTIYVEELDIAYAIKSSDGDWWLITSGGVVTEQITENEAANHTQVLGVTLESPEVNADATAVELVPTETTPEGELVPIAVTGSQRLYAALQILKALEANDIVGDAASIDVSRLEDVILWYGTRYQVNLGDTSRMEYKIACMNDAILQLSEYQSGILDVSFTIWPDQVGYTPFG